MGGICSSQGAVDKELMRDMFGQSTTAPKKVAKQTSKRSKSGAVLLASREFWTLYTLVRHISNSPYGSMDIVRNVESSKEFAAKHVSKRQAMATVTDVKVEVEVLRHLAGHPHLVQLHEAYEDEEATHLVIEMCSGGDMVTRLAGTASESYRDEKQAAANFRQVIEAVEHLHSLGVMHRDIKPENFIFTDATDMGVLKLSDFGLAVFCEADQRLSDIVGSPTYMAPEVLTRSYNKEADIWSCGVILYMMLSGRPPFTGSSQQEVINAVTLDSVDISSSPWREVSKPARHLVRKMLCKDPIHRASMDEVLHHPWLRRDGVADKRPIPAGVAERMLKIQNLSQFMKDARKFLGSTLPPIEVQGLKALFQELDGDSDGRLTMRELQEALKRKANKLPADKVEKLMSKADLDGDGFLDIGEFVASTLAMSRMRRDEVLHATFSRFDKDKDGIISTHELGKALQYHSGVADVSAIMAELELDEVHGGKYHFDDFSAMLKEEDNLHEEDDGMLLLVPVASPIAKPHPHRKASVKEAARTDSPSQQTDDGTVEYL